MRRIILKECGKYSFCVVKGPLLPKTRTIEQYNSQIKRVLNAIYKNMRKKTILKKIISSKETNTNVGHGIKIFIHILSVFDYFARYSRKLQRVKIVD